MYWDTRGRNTAEILRELERRKEQKEREAQAEREEQAAYIRSLASFPQQNAYATYATYAVMNTAGLMGGDGGGGSTGQFDVYGVGGTAAPGQWYPVGETSSGQVISIGSFPRAILPSLADVVMAKEKSPPQPEIGWEEWFTAPIIKALAPPFFPELDFDGA